MIGLLELGTAAAVMLEERTGVRSFCTRVEHMVYPALIVSCEAGKTSVRSGGNQIDRQVTVCVTCYPSRERERSGGMALADRVQNALSQTFTACGRVLTPEEITIRKTAGELFEVTFRVAFSDTTGKHKDEPSEVLPMQRLTLRMSRKREEL